MIGLLVVAHGTLGSSLIECVTYVLGHKPTQLESLDLTAFPDAGLMHAEAEAMLARIDQGDGVLVLADVYGATPCNTVCRLLSPGHVAVVVGVNVPMLLKTLTYRDRATLEDLATRAEHGAREGVLRLAGECNAHA
ncbi:MAG: PTS fructose transporter subunit IIA [Betaproteobacteria bacterium]|nr:MAG: PTS fructose transporter subunit IIA [Betaproteobacteria bacterium]